MTTHTLTRTGLPPLRFTGRLLAEASSAQEHGSRRHRYHVIRLYEVEQDSRAEGPARRVVQIEYRSVPSRTNSRHEHGYDQAEAVEASAVPEYLADYDPAEDVTGGYPPIERFAVQQVRMVSEVVDGFDAAVSAVLAAAGYVETI